MAWRPGHRWPRGSTPNPAGGGRWPRPATKPSISIVLAVGSGSEARSSSVTGITEPSASSYALTVSEAGTSSSSSSQTLWYRIRPPSERWICRKEIEWFSVAFISLTGMLTRPNAMEPFQMDLTVHPSHPK